MSKNIVVLGASGNIGGPAVKSLLEAGHKVVAPYRSADALEKIKKVRQSCCVAGDECMLSE